MDNDSMQIVIIYLFEIYATYPLNPESKDA